MSPERAFLRYFQSFIDFLDKKKNISRELLIEVVLNVLDYSIPLLAVVVGAVMWRAESGEFSLLFMFLGLFCTGKYMILRNIMQNHPARNDPRYEVAEVLMRRHLRWSFLVLLLIDFLFYHITAGYFLGQLCMVILGIQDVLFAFNEYLICSKSRR
ncbi:MAG: hypothetical protein JWN37_579 [Candidatus Nomurabacteria bacterium]|nr:hypothetical protein [Candidatus Nomurabacteria bacterium]